MDYIATSGQTYIPFQENIYPDMLPYTPLDRPQPPLPELELNDMTKEKGWIITVQRQHFVPGVTSEMLDWWWANMEKGYYLWAPGSHKRFNWVREPWKYGFERSAHIMSESVGKGLPVFGGNGVLIERLPLSWFPFTTHLDHVICEGIFNNKGEFVDSTVHMWQDVPGGCIHIDAAVANPGISEPPNFVLEMLAEDPNACLVPPASTDHGEYEAARWPVFLPTLYGLWKGHPDPTQNVLCDLRVEDTPDGLRYIAPNGPVVFDEE